VRLCRTENRFKEPRLLSRGAPQYFYFSRKIPEELNFFENQPKKLKIEKNPL
jgi:hypothetical protein